MVLAVIICFLVLLINLPLLIIVAAEDLKPPDLKSDKVSLLAFYNALPLVGRGDLNWNQVDDICNWTGVNCTSEMPTMVSIKGGRVNTSKENRVVTLQLPGKKLFGPIAANSIGKLDALETLSLRSNLLYGNIPPDILSISTLRSISLQENNFCGDIPRFSKFPNYLLLLDLSFNSFTGDISRLLLKKMEQRMTLNLQFNSFSGRVPDVIDKKKVKSLNLSHNKLDGQIPSSLQKLPAASFIGNDGLCGKPLDDCPIPPAYPPLSSAAYSNKLGAIALTLPLHHVIHPPYHFRFESCRRVVC